MLEQQKQLQREILKLQLELKLNLYEQENTVRPWDNKTNQDDEDSSLSIVKFID